MLRVVLFRDSGYWIAQGLEVDLNAQGSSPEKAVHNLRATLEVRAELDRRDGVEPFSRSRRADEQVFHLFERARPWAASRRQLSENLPLKIDEIRESA